MMAGSPESKELEIGLEIVARLKKHDLEPRMRLDCLATSGADGESRLSYTPSLHIGRSRISNGKLFPFVELFKALKSSSILSERIKRFSSIRYFISSVI
jgi:hypothetical protein